MGNDDDEVVKGLDGVGVLQVEQKNEDIDVNENLEGLDSEKKSMEGNFGNGEVDQVGLTKKGEVCVGGVGELNFEVGVVDDSLKTPPPRKRGRPRKNKGGGSSNSEVKDELDKKSVGELSTGISQRTRNRVVKGRVEGGDDDDDMINEMYGVEVDDEDVKESGFCVGNFVWGKIKSHPWWPGRVYNSSCVSNFALKYKHEGRVLVAYFGDGTFAWCDPSQLKPFELNFGEMSRQSGLKSFVSAVEAAVEEFGSVVEGNMICAMTGSQSSMPLVVNAGIKQGVHVPLEGVEGFSVDKFESTKILDNIKSFARFEFAVSLLEIRVLRSLLSVCYQSKGVLLPTYHEPVGIEELIHLDIQPEEVSTHGPGDGDWLVGPGDQALIQDEMGTASKKVKAITDLLGTNRNTELEENDADGSKREMKPRLLTSRSGRKRKVNNEDETVRPKLDSDEIGTTAKENDQSGNPVLKSGRGRRKKIDENQSPLAENSRITRSSTRKGRGSEILATSRKRASKAKKDVSEVETETVKSPRNQGMSVGIRIDRVLTSEEGQDQRMSPREKKRSRYLSPPYTSLLDQKQRNSDLEFSDVAKMGEKMSKVASKLVGSPPLVKCSAETFQKSSRGAGSTHAKTEANHSTRKLRSNVTDSVKSIGSSNDVLCEIRSAALDPICLKTIDESFDSIKGFLCSYRDVNFNDGSNGQSSKNQTADKQKRKRKSTETTNGSDVNVQNRVDKHSSEPKIPAGNTPKKRERKSDSKVDATSAASLVIKFPPDFTLPSKEDLLKIHSPFGPLDESKSKVTPKSSSVKVVFIKRLDAEAAQKNLQQSNPFGTANVSYKIKHVRASVSETKKPISEKKKTSKSTLTQKPKSSDKHPSGVAEDEPLSVVVIKKKLETMTSMLGEADGKMTAEVKSNLENEAKELLKKVKMMKTSSPSS